MTAIFKGQTEVAKLLALSPLSNLELQDQSGLTALHFAALSNQPDLAKLLVIERNVDINQQDWLYRRTALMCAIMEGHTEVAKLLALHPSARVELQDATGMDACDFAAHYRQTEVLAILLHRQGNALINLLDTAIQASLEDASS